MSKNPINDNINIDSAAFIDENQFQMKNENDLISNNNSNNTINNNNNSAISNNNVINSKNIFNNNNNKDVDVVRNRFENLGIIRIKNCNNDNNNNCEDNKMINMYNDQNDDHNETLINNNGLCSNEFLINHHQKQNFGPQFDDGQQQQQQHQSDPMDIDTWFLDHQDDVLKFIDKHKKHETIDDAEDYNDNDKDVNKKLKINDNHNNNSAEHVITSYSSSSTSSLSPPPPLTSSSSSTLSSPSLSSPSSSSAKSTNHQNNNNSDNGLLIDSNNSIVDDGEWNTTTITLAINDNNNNNNNNHENMENVLNQTVTNDKYDDDLITIQLSDLKSNYSEFADFVLLFLYINNVKNCDYQFYQNGLKLKFETDYNLIPNKNNEIPLLNPILFKDNFVYELDLTFKHEIVPEKCSLKVSKKTIEIRLQKLLPIAWGTIKELCITPTVSSSSSSFSTVINDNDCNNNNAMMMMPSVINSNSMFPKSSTSITPMSTFCRDQWTPCKLSTPSTTCDSNNMMLTVSKSSINDMNNDADSAVKTDRLHGRFRGFTGLDNLGNTCFMNAVLQCLANTDPLRDYFLSNEYLNDINTKNPLGMKGLMAKAFSQFLLQLWMGKQSSISPTRLKSLIGEKVITFAGFGQHDAQELMSFLLDAIHEDLNRNDIKVNADPVDNNASDHDSNSSENDADNSLIDYDIDDCPSDEIREEILEKIHEMADRAWKQYRLRNNSIVIDLFCGQFKSILTCPDCTKKSIMFDPFLFVPLPIPPPKLIYNVIYFDRDHSTDMCKSVSKFSIRIAQNSTVNDLLEKLYREKKVIPTKNVRIMQPQLQSNHHFQSSSTNSNNNCKEILPVKFFNTNWLLTDCQQSSNQSYFFNNNNHHNQLNSNQQPLLLFELPPTRIDDDENDIDNTGHVELCIIQRELRENSDCRNQVGFPFVCCIEKCRLSYSHLCQVLCSYARFSVIAYRQAMIVDNDSNQINASLNRFNVHSFTPKNLSKCSNNNNNNNNNMETNSDQLPHLIYHKCKIEQPNDTITPFLLMSLSFDMNSHESEITPAEFLSYKNVDMQQYDNINNNHFDEVAADSSTLIIDEDTPMQEPSSSSSSHDEPESIDEIDNDNTDKHAKQIADEYDVEIVSYDNDALIDLSDLYFIGMDWITIQDYPSLPFSVNLNSLDKNIEYVNLGNHDDDDVTLDDCLQLFIEPEILGPQNCWRCPNCKVPREASKQLSFWRLPSILVIQLKRFKTHSMMYNHEKINYMIKYPFKLNLSKYVIDNKQQEPESQSVYELYAVVNHQGSASWGHYTAFARSSHTKEFDWRLFDDNCVDKVTDEREVITSKAYLLFYRRIENY